MIVLQNRRGMTLIEVLISITLLSLLMTGMLWAIRIGVTSMGRANQRLLANRRITGAQKILEQQIGGLIPVAALQRGGAGIGSVKFAFFQGEPQSMRFVSSYSLQEASRGIPRILEFQVIPGIESGVRLIVNEFPYTGPIAAGISALGKGPGPETGTMMMHFGAITPNPSSFVLADKLVSCHFMYQELKPKPDYQKWTDIWAHDKWPDAIRIEMQPLEDTPGRLKMISLTTPIHVKKMPLEVYADQ